MYFTSFLFTCLCSLFARVAIIVSCSLALSATALALVPSTIYVSAGNYSPDPYYNFYADSDLTEILDITTGGTESLLTSEIYTFIKASSSHPFYLGDQGYNALSSSDVTISGQGSYTSGIGGGESLVLSFNNYNPDTEALFYFCTAHGNMISTFNVAVPEAASYAAILSTFGLTVVLTRRKIRN